MWPVLHSTNLRWRFSKVLWPSQIYMNFIYLVYAWQSAGYKMFGCKTFISVKVKWKNALKLVLTAQSALVQQWPTGPSLGPVLWRRATTRAPQRGQNSIEIVIKYSYHIFQYSNFTNICLYRLFFLRLIVQFFTKIALIVLSVQVEQIE